MGETARPGKDLRTLILEEPDLILEDRDLMRELMRASESTRDENIVDIRQLAMARLEARLNRLEDTHRSVIAAAYDNLAGTHQVHRAVIRLLEPVEFEAFLRALHGDVAETLRVSASRLVFESAHGGDTPALGRLAGLLSLAEPGFVDDYLSHGRDLADRPVTLRNVTPDGGGLYGGAPGWIRSEACLRIDLGADRMPAMLALGSDDARLFEPGQGTDLLTFFASAVERVLRRWLA